MRQPFFMEKCFSTSVSQKKTGEGDIGVYFVLYTVLSATSDVIPIEITENQRYQANVQ